MNINKFEQSGFIIETQGGFRLAIDIGNKTPIEKLNGLKVDAFIASHFHGDHFSLPQISALQAKNIYLSNECQQAILSQETLAINTIKNGDIVEMGGEIEVQIFSVDHGPNVSAPLTENFGFLIKCNDKTLYFAGDMFYESGMDVTNLEVDYALIPIGGFYTFGPKEAFNFLKKFKSIKKVISMHYDITPETKDEFLKLSKETFNVE